MLNVNARIWQGCAGAKSDSDCVGWNLKAPFSSMRDIGDQSNEHQEVPGSQSTAANVEENIQTFPPDRQHSQMSSSLAGTSSPCAAKHSPDVGEERAPLSPPPSPAGLSSVCHTHQPASPQPSEVQLAAARDQAPMTGYGSDAPGDIPPPLTAPSVGLSPAHRQIPSNLLPPSPPDDAAAIYETAPPAIHHTGGPVAYGTISGQLPAVPAAVGDPGHDASVHDMPTLEHANVATPASDAPFPAVQDPPLPVPLQQGNSADSPALPLAPVSHPPTEPLAPDCPLANAPQQHVPCPASNSTQLSLASEPPQQQANASAAPLAHLDSPHLTGSAPSITEYQSAPAAITLSKKSTVIGGPPDEPDTPSVVVAPDPADPQPPRDPTSVSKLPLNQQVVQGPDPEQGPSNDVQKAPVLQLQPEGRLSPSKQTVDDLHASYQEWLAQEVQAGLLGDENLNETADGQLAGQDSSIRRAQGTLDAYHGRLDGWAKEYVDGHLRFSKRVPGPLISALNKEIQTLLRDGHKPASPSSQLRLQSQTLATILDKIVDASCINKCTSNPGAGPASDTAPAQGDALTAPITAGAASDMAPAQGKANTAPMDPLHGKSTGTTRAGVASDKVPAQDQASTAPIAHLHDRDVVKVGGGAASGKTPAEGQDSTAPPDTLLGKEAAGPEAAANKVPALSQASTSLMKVEISSSTDAVSGSKGSKHGTVVSMADDKTGQAVEPLAANVPESSGRHAENPLNLEGMISPPEICRCCETLGFFSIRGILAVHSVVAFGHFQHDLCDPS